MSLSPLYNVDRKIDSGQITDLPRVDLRMWEIPWLHGSRTVTVPSGSVGTEFLDAVRNTWKPANALGSHSAPRTRKSTTAPSRQVRNEQPQHSRTEDSEGNGNAKRIGAGLVGLGAVLLLLFIISSRGGNGEPPGGDLPRGNLDWCGDSGDCPDEEDQPPAPAPVQLVNTFTQRECDVNCQSSSFWQARCTEWGVYSDGSQRILTSYSCD